MKTYQDLIDFCANTDGFEEYVEPLVRIRKNGEGGFYDAKPEKNLSRTIMSFAWRHTKEGWTFWDGLFDKLLEAGQ